MQFALIHSYYIYVYVCIVGGQRPCPNKYENRKKNPPIPTSRILYIGKKLEIIDGYICTILYLNIFCNKIILIYIYISIYINLFLVLVENVLLY